MAADEESVVEKAARELGKPKSMKTGVIAEMRRRAAGAGIPRLEIEFEVDHALCNPGMFDETFVIRLRACSAGQEEQAARRAGQDPIVYIRSLAQMAIVAVNGEKVTDADAVSLWEALGPAGRTMIADRYAQMARPDDEAAGKALETTRVL